MVWLSSLFAESEQQMAKERERDMQETVAGLENTLCSEREEKKALLKTICIPFTLFHISLLFFLTSREAQQQTDLRKLQEEVGALCNELEMMKSELPEGIDEYDCDAEEGLMPHA